MRLLAQQFLSRAATHPDSIAVIDASGEHTAGAIASAAAATADQIAGIAAGAPTVVIQADNTARTLVTALAVGLRGGVVAVVSPHATASEFALALEDIDPDAVVGDPLSHEHWGVPAAHFPLSVTATDGQVIRARPDFRDLDRWNGGTAIAMTSGSTGRPKCVVQSEDAIRYACDATIDAVGLRPGDAVGAFVPLSSVAALCFGMYLPAHLGGTMVTVGKWAPDIALRAMAEHRVAWTMLVPTMALQLSIVDGAAGALTAMRAMTVGGGPMNAHALQQAEELLGTTFLRVFGMSECLGHTTPALHDPPALRLGRDGRPFPGTVVRAVGTDGASVPSGEIGDAQVRGPSLFVGYARGGVAVPPDLTADGFLPTGDLVEVDEDGTIRVMVRQKQIIIRGGRNIDINELEAAIASIPQVVQVCVVPVPDDMLGERAAALVVTGGPQLTLDEATRHLARSEFPRFKWPEYLFTVEDLPQNRVGKLSRSDAVGLASRLVARSNPSSPRVTSPSSTI